MAIEIEDLENNIDGRNYDNSKLIYLLMHFPSD